MSDKIREALAGMLAIVDESRGVDGYHLSGDIAEWDTFPEVEIARAALAQQPAQATTEGWKLVPVGMTPEMRAAWDAAPKSEDDDEEMRSAYRAMLAAAPAAPAPAAQEPVAQCPFCGESSGHCNQGFPHPRKTAKAPPATEKPDTVAVPREILERLAGSPDVDPDCCVAYYRQKLRALLAGGAK